MQDVDVAEVGRQLAAGRVRTGGGLQRWSRLVYTVALRSVATQADAEDITQAVFISAWRSRASFSPGPATCRGGCWPSPGAGSPTTHRKRRDGPLDAPDLHDAPDITDQVSVADGSTSSADPASQIIRLAFYDAPSPASRSPRRLNAALGTVRKPYPPARCSKCVRDWGDPCSSM